MFRKLTIAVAAALTLGAGVAYAPAPAAAQGVGIYLGNGHHSQRHYAPPPRRHYSPPRRQCERVVIRKRVHGEWRRIVERRCGPRHYRRY
jgi:hypothetical protein